ncbi:MAG: MlaD family protein [Planctomycetota bacterium]
MQLPSRNFMGVAATFVAGLFLLGYFTTYLLWEDLRPWRSYRVTFVRTIGLAKEDPVFVYGYKVGRVHQISLEGDHQLVELQVEPFLAFHREELRVVIEPIDAFGNAGIFVDPGRPGSDFWDPVVPIRGEFRESLAASSDTSSSTGLSESLKGLEEFTDTLTKIDASWLGRLVNDPDPGFGLRETFEGLRARTRNIREATIEAYAGDGFGQLLTKDNAVTFAQATGGTRDNIQNANEALAAGVRGEGGALGRLVGDRDAAVSMREQLGLGASLFRGYQHAEGGITGALNHSNDSAERLGGILDFLAERTGDARLGQGTTGGLFGPQSGFTATETLAGLSARLESMTAADAEAGTFYSRAPEGRRATDDIASRIDDVLRDMRRALTRIRADQGANTFPGALLSVF